MAGIPQINIIKIPPSLTGFDVVGLSYHGSRITNLPVGLSYHGSRCSQRLQSGCHSRNAPRASANGFAVLRGRAVCGCHNVTALHHMVITSMPKSAANNQEKQRSLLKDKYPASDSDKACAAGERATTQIGKNGENKAAIFRFNPGKSMKLMPPKHPYLPKGCGDCSYNKLAYNPNSEKCQACNELLKMVRSVQEKTIAADKAKTVAAIKSIKQTIPPYDGIVMPGKIFETGKMTMLRRSFDDIYEHAIENEDVRKWLQSFSIDNLNELKYKGWAYCHPYLKDHPKYDSANPLKSKHDTDTEYFLYYTIKIGKRDYWVNVKMHKEYGEVVYTIEKEKPHDIIKGHKKK